MLYLHWLLKMSTFSRMALTVTLALGASLSLIGSKFVQAEVNTIARSLETTPVREVMHSAFYSDSQPVLALLDSTFDPEPNEPPDRTGGSGTR